MAEPFSTTDVYYTKANCIKYPSSKCNNQDIFDIPNCECKYKTNVKKLNTVSASNGLTKSQNGDLNKEHSLLVFNNISLGVGIAGMMWIMYS
jgi:hypothetical protein